MSKLTFKQFLDEQAKGEQAKGKNNAKRPQDKQGKEALPGAAKIARPKPIALKQQVKPIATTDEKRVPSQAELALKAALKQSTRQGHMRTLADILGIYPT